MSSIVEQRAGSDPAGRIAEMGRDRRVPDEVQLVGLAHRDAHVAADIAPRTRLGEVGHVRPRVATACATVISRSSAPESTSSTRAEPWPVAVPRISTAERTGPILPNPR